MGSANAHNAVSLWSEQQTTRDEAMRIHQDGQPDDWGDRAVHWLRQRFVNWPMKAVARELDEAESVVKSWWCGGAHPDRRKLQRLRDRFGKEGFSSFVFGEPCREEITARLDALTTNIEELKGYLNARRLARETRERADKARGVVRAASTPTPRAQVKRA